MPFYIANTGRGWGGGGVLLLHLSSDSLPLYGASFRLFPLIFTPHPTPSYSSPYLFYVKASARFPILERRAAKTIVWREQFHQHYCAHPIFYLLIITIITIGTFSPMQVIHAEREETNIQNWSVICHLVIKKNRERHGLRLKELKTHFPCTLVFFSSTKKRLVTNSTLSHYNAITTLYWSIIWCLLL